MSAGKKLLILLMVVVVYVIGWQTLMSDTDGPSRLMRHFGPSAAPVQPSPFVTPTTAAEVKRDSTAAFDNLWASQDGRGRWNLCHDYRMVIPAYYDAKLMNRLLKAECAELLKTGPGATTFADGVHNIGYGIQAGQYKTSGGHKCTATVARSDNFSETNITERTAFDGPTVIDLTEKHFIRTSGGCVWKRIT